MTGSLTRRERVRAATIAEVHETARRLLVADGLEGVTLRAIAREMGMTAPALYRYYSSREDLILHLVGSLYEDLTRHLAAARDALPDEPVIRSLEVPRAFRRWALDHPREFELVFATPLGDIAARKAAGGEPAPLPAGMAFGEVFIGLFVALLSRRPVPVPADDEVPEALRVQLHTWRDSAALPMPIGAMHLFLVCWTRLYGQICMEVFGQLDWCLSDPAPAFEAMLADLTALLGHREFYRPPT